jgi:lipid A 4'-phosphatase
VTARPPFWTRPPAAGELTKVAAIGFGLLAVSVIVPAIAPRIDLVVSSWFYVGPGLFALMHAPFWDGLRELFLDAFTVWYLLLAVMTFVALRTGNGLGRWNADRWLYQAAASVLGPWLLVNVILKEFWGRWRPVFVTQFGGNETFAPPLDWSGSCASNCAFVSGEVASMVMLFVGAALVSTVWRPVFYAAALLFGAAIAFIRIGMGGHFLSDTLAAAGLMTLLAVGLLLVFRRFGREI